MFFTTLGDIPKIQRASLDGSSVLVIVRSMRLVRPHVICLDLANQHVYWADSYLERVERVDYDGQNRYHMIKWAKVNIRVFSMVIGGKQFM